MRGGASVDAGAAADLLQHGQGRRRRGRVRRGDVEVLLVQGAEPGGAAPQAGGGDPAPGLRRLPKPAGAARGCSPSSWTSLPATARWSSSSSRRPLLQVNNGVRSASFVLGFLLWFSF